MNRDAFIIMRFGDLDEIWSLELVGMSDYLLLVEIVLDVDCGLVDVAASLQGDGTTHKEIGSNFDAHTICAVGKLHRVALISVDVQRFAFFVTAEIYFNAICRLGENYCRRIAILKFIELEGGEVRRKFFVNFIDFRIDSTLVKGLVARCIADGVFVLYGFALSCFHGVAFACTAG